MKKLYLFLIIPFLLGATIPEPPKDDKLSTETQQYLKIIYEELKRDNDVMVNLVDLTSGVTGILPVASGGTEKITQQTAIDNLLPSQSGASGKFLTSNGTTSSWGSVTDTNLSNVIYSWAGSDQAVVNASGIYSGSSLTPDLQTFPNPFLFMGRSAATYRTIIQGQWTKIAGVSTVTIHAKLWAGSVSGVEEALLKVDIGGQNNTVKSVTSTTPTWVTTSTIDVSGLTNGTVYTIDILMANETATASSYCSGIMLIGS